MIIKRRRRTTEEDRAKELAKAREKRQKKMIRTKYGQVPKRHARQGIKSCICILCWLHLCYFSWYQFLLLPKGRSAYWLDLNWPFCACYGRTWAGVRDTRVQRER